MKIARTTTTVTALEGDRPGFGRAEVLTVDEPDGKLKPTGEEVQVISLDDNVIPAGRTVSIDESDDAHGKWVVLRLDRD